MRLLTELLEGDEKGIIVHLANRLGISENEIQRALVGLIPALGEGIKQNLSTPEGERELITALQNGNHHRFSEDSQTLLTNNSVIEGNQILQHILGGKNESRILADNAATETGLSASIMKQILPMAAGLLMGGLGKEAMAGGLLSNESDEQSENRRDGLLAILDFDNDGSVVDDIFNVAGKFL